MGVRHEWDALWRAVAAERSRGEEEEEVEEAGRRSRKKGGGRDHDGVPSR